MQFARLRTTLSLLAALALPLACGDDGGTGSTAADGSTGGGTADEVGTESATGTATESGTATATTTAGTETTAATDTTGGCAPNEIDCAGNCVDITSDPNNCGDCGNACGLGQTCDNGVCVGDCAGVMCGMDCVDITSDPNHCGT